MTSNQDVHLSGLVSAANTIADQTLAGFGDVTAHHLNWKPSAEQWSVAQCFDHLVTSNEAYFGFPKGICLTSKEDRFANQTLR